MKKNPQRYEGILAKPMDPTKPDPSDMLERVVALKDHYGISSNLDDGGLMELLLALARDHVPGFAFADVSNEIIPDKHAIRDFILISEIERLRSVEGGSFSVRNAARIFSRKFPQHGLSAESARVRYSEIIKGIGDRGRKRQLELLKLVYCMDNSKG